MKEEYIRKANEWLKEATADQPSGEGNQHEMGRALMVVHSPVLTSRIWYWR